MGMLPPPSPPVDLPSWRRLPHMQKVHPLVLRWVEYGAETPLFVLGFYLIKAAAFVVGGLALLAATPGLGGLGDLSNWWSEPIVYQKAIVFIWLFELLGLGGSSGPLTFKFLPPVIGFLHWLRPGTIRQPPWSKRVPLTRGDSRTVVDVVLMLATIAVMVSLLVVGGAGPVPPGATVGLLPHGLVIALVVLMVVLGLRDKVSVIAGRADLYLVPTIIFLFPYDQMMIGLKIALVGIWVGAGVSKLTRHFAPVVTVMTSNAPFRPRWFKRLHFANFPEDVSPSRFAFGLAHMGTLVEIPLVLVMLFSTNTTLTHVLVVIMVIFHLNIISFVPLAVPNEWNIFMIFAAIWLFWTHAEVAVTDLGNPLLIAVLVLGLVVPVVLGNMRPDLVSFAFAMRYYAGNWPASLWCFRGDAAERISANVVKSAGLVSEQLTRIYDADYAELMTYRMRAFRSMHIQGRALNGLLPRALDDVDAYEIIDGELFAGPVNGWNMGDGHMHNWQLLESIQRRCHYAPGELVLVHIESQPIHRQQMRYHLIDAATGQFETGHIHMSDLADRQPWSDAPLPVDVDPSNSGRN